MSHPYTDRYPIGENISERLRDHEKRIKELESKLGAAEVAATANAERSQKGHIPAPTAAPRVSAEEWRGWARENRRDGRNRSARACELAAAVTEWRESIAREKYSLGQAEDLIRIVIAFVRGEPLPQKGG